MKVAGIDLAGKPENQTGFCLLTEDGSETKILHTDLDILKEIKKTKPDLIAVDAPFWVPKTGNQVVPWRNAEELLMKRGFRPLSIAFPTMQLLANRAKHLVSVLRERGYKVIEVFPRATEIILNVSKEYRKNEDEYDALLCALTGKYYLEGKFEDLDGIIIPK